jgi:hypothetical protein
LATSVLEEVTNSEAHRAIERETAENALVVSEAVDCCGLVNRPAGSASDERRDRCCDTGDGSHAAWDFLDVNSRICRCDRHSEFSFYELALSVVPEEGGGGLRVDRRISLERSWRRDWF